LRKDKKKKASEVNITLPHTFVIAYF
jgi:hypothetical protein